MLRFLLPVVAAVTLSACGINTVPTREEAAKAAWADVENQYQRRADLIPNLVSTVKGFAAQEREVLEAVTAARASAIGPITAIVGCRLRSAGENKAARMKGAAASSARMKTTSGSRQP